MSEKLRHHYGKDFNPKIQELLESNDRNDVKIGISMLLSEQGFRAGRTIWMEDDTTFHPAPLVVVSSTVHVTRHASIDRPSVDLNCVEVINDWTEKGELVQVGVTLSHIIHGEAMSHFTYEYALEKGVRRMTDHLMEFERTVDRFDEGVKILESKLKSARFQRKVQKENVKQARKRMERLKSDPSAKESLEYLANIQKAILSQIMIIEPEEVLAF